MALAIGAASPSFASNEVRITVDPLNWEWSGSIELGDSDNPTTVPFNVGPGGGPQRVATAQANTALALSSNSLGVALSPSVVTNPNTGESETLTGYFGAIDNQWLGDMEIGMWVLDADEWSAERYAQEPVVVKSSLAKFTDPSTNDDFYEFKLFLKNEAPTADAALQNLHKVQSGGVDACDVAVTAEPGDVVSGTDGDDAVCVTVEDGRSDDPITIEAGGGDDTVLMSGDTNATVVVDTGAGDDVVVADTDANVEITGGSGVDAANVANLATSLEDCPGRWVFGPMNLPVCAY